MTEHLLFLTGKLAKPGLTRTLESMKPPFSFEVYNLGLSVAALMTAEMIIRRLESSRGAQKIIVPGLCSGDLTQVEAHLGVPVVRGPEDQKDLPGFFGHSKKITDLSGYDIRIFAEIVHGPNMTVDEILAQAKDYQRNGADVIDLGCLPGKPFPHLAESIATLKTEGFLVSVDSLDENDLLKGGKAGADFLLSLKMSSLWILDEVTSCPILIPETAGDLDSLFNAMQAVESLGRPYIADSILDPIHFGFTESIVRYHELRRCYPDCEIMMGTGNLSELTDADTTGLNMLMLGMMSELRINNLLTTQVSPHARSCVRELDRARRILHAARLDNSLPRGYDPGLLTIHDRKPFPYTHQEILETASQIRDPSYRVQVGQEGIYVYNRERVSTATDPYDLFPQLDLLKNDAPHAFYMGVELSKAQIAWQIGKRYMQDEELRWGVATTETKKTDVATLHAYKGEGATLQAKKLKKTEEE